MVDAADEKEALTSSFCTPPLPTATAINEFQGASPTKGVFFNLGVTVRPLLPNHLPMTMGAEQSEVTLVSLFPTKAKAPSTHKLQHQQQQQKHR